MTLNGFDFGIAAFLELAAPFRSESGDQNSVHSTFSIQPDPAAEPVLCF